MLSESSFEIVGFKQLQSCRTLHTHLIVKLRWACNEPHLFCNSRNIMWLSTLNLLLRCIWSKMNHALSSYSTHSGSVDGDEAFWAVASRLDHYWQEGEWPEIADDQVEHFAETVWRLTYIFECQL
jgi:hypothetical protein